MSKGKVQVELNREGVRALMKSEGMQGICKKYANEARSRLGEGYEVTEYQGKNRCNASIAAQSTKAREENLKENTILKAVGSI